MHRGCFVWTPTPPLAGPRMPRPGPVRVCVCSSVLAGSGGPASRAHSGAPHLFFWPLCLSALLGPLRAGFAPVLVLCLPAVSSFALFFFSVSPLFFSLRPLCLLLSLVSGPGCPGPWRFVLFVLLASRFLAFRALSLSFCCLAVGRSPVVAPPPLSLAVVAVPCCLALLFFLFSSCPRPLASGYRCFPAPALGLGAGVCLFCSALRALCCFFFPPLGSSCALAFFVSPGWRLVAAPPPLPCLAVFVVFARCLGFFFSSCAPPLSPAFSGFRPRVPWALALCFVCFSRPPAARLSVRARLVCVIRLAVGCSLVVAAPPRLPFCVSPFS